MFKKIIILLISFNIQALKIDRVILSTDNNPLYIEFWPIVAKMWQERIGIKPTLALIANKYVVVDESLGDVIRFEPIENIPTSLQAQVIRLLLPAYFEEDVCLISDIDMIPINKSYFLESVKNFSDDNFIVYRDKAYENEPDKEKYPMCYNVAKGKIFKDIFKIKDITQISEIIKQWHSLNLGWNTDETILYKYLNEWEKSKTNCKLGHNVEKRIDRLNWQYDYKLVNDFYIDAHCLRPYSKYKKEIDKLIDCLNYEIQEKADLLIYSFDRPLQLYALLESIEKYITNLGEVNIIYRVSNEEFSQSYNDVIKNFPNYNFHKQGKNPYADFKPLVMKHAFETVNNYIIFAVDDIIVKDYFDISKCIKALKYTGAYGFYLRLGKNITECYMEGIKTPIPFNNNIFDDIYIYQFKNGLGDWGYPNANDMVIYKKRDIKYFFEKTFFKSTAYEGPWSTFADKNKFGLFFETSKILNIPMNLTKEIAQDNKNMNLFSIEQLLKIFQNNYKINIEKFYKISNNSPHMEYIPEFIKS